jgi:hypothetical protein
MANDNNNINKLVAEDNDQTAELEVLSFVKDDLLVGEINANTFDARDDSYSETFSGLSTADLKSEVRFRDKIIDRLRFDFEQSHSKTLGLEAENRARQKQTMQLNNELSIARDLVARKERHIDERERDIDVLSYSLDEAEWKSSLLSDELALTVDAVQEAQSALAGSERKHDDEIRMLRFEMGAAQDTIVETGERNSRLATDLADVCEIRDELERVLGYVEDQSAERIEQLRQEVKILVRSADKYKHKLTRKGEAVSALLSELARKSKQSESTHGTGQVACDHPVELFERPAGTARHGRPAPDKLSRVLIGTLDQQELRFPLFKNRLTIGRTGNNDIKLNADFVSRRHAVIQTNGEMTRIIDWGSKNGIYVNSSKMSEHFLSHGDTVTIGSACFRYEERKKRNI